MSPLPRPALLFAAFAVIAGSAFAQHTLTGTISNAATGQNLEGARVVLKGTGRETLTDQQGVYRFDNVPAGAAVLQVSYTGLQPVEQAVQVTSTGPTQRHDIGLTADIYQMSKFVVAGEREGQAQAITLQRNSDGIKSIVSADAFGGLAGNPAELIARLPGIEGESVGGDVRYIRVRGLSQNLSSITMDGNRIADGASATAGGGTREFQFQTISSDAIERIEVVKLPTPDIDGDSIGGNINMVTKSAFDSTPERRIRGSLGYIWRATDDRDRPRPNLSLSYSEVFAGRFAVAVNAGYRAHASIAEQTTQTHQQLPAGVTGPAYTHTFTFTDFRNIRKRSGLSVRFDYKFSDTSRYYVNWQYNKHVEHEDDAEANFATNQGIAAGTAPNFTGTNGIIPGYTDTVTEVRAVNNSVVTLSSENLYKDGRTANLNAGGVHRYRTLEVTYDAYISSSKANYAGTATPSFIARNIGWRLDRSENAYLPAITQTAGPDWTDISTYTQNSFNIARRAMWDEYVGASLNAKKSFDTRFPTYVKTGWRLREQTRRNVNTPFSGTYVGPDGVMGPNPAQGGRNDDNLEQFMERRTLPGDLGRYPNLPFPRVVGKGRTFWTALEENPALLQQNLAANLQAELQGNTRFEETIDAYYLMGNVSFGRLSLLTGARIETTDVEAEGARQQITPAEAALRTAWGSRPLTDEETRRRTLAEFGSRVTRTGEMRHVLPGVHFKYSPFPNSVVRLGWARNIGRPSIGQLIPTTTINDEARTVRTSNPELKPQIADNYDLSLEYYFEPAGVVTAGVFYKDIESFIYEAGGATIPAGQDNGFGGEFAGYTLTTHYNGGQGKVKGLELSYNQQFTFLPGWLKGFGAFANYTRMEAEGNYGSGGAIGLAPTPKIPGFNPLNANVGLSYIRNKLTLRAQWNYRGRYLLTFNANESRLVYARARDTLGIKTAYRFNRRFEAYFDVVNLLSEPDREREFTGGRVQVYSMLLPQLYFGINARL